MRTFSQIQKLLQSQFKAKHTQHDTILILNQRRRIHCNDSPLHKAKPMTTEQSTKLAVLKKAAAEGAKALLIVPKEKVMEAYEQMEAANKELAEYEESLITPEQRRAQKAYDKAKDALDKALEAYEQTKTALGVFKPELLKKAGAKVFGSGDHGQKLTYEQAQEIRKLLAEGGKTKKEIAEEYGVSTATITDIEKYINFRLKRGDVAHTPLINSVYPANYLDDNENMRHGAPYADDAKGVRNTRKGYEAISDKDTKEDEGSEE